MHKQQEEMYAQPKMLHIEYFALEIIDGVIYFDMYSYGSPIRFVNFVMCVCLTFVGSACA